MGKRQHLSKEVVACGKECKRCSFKVGWGKFGTCWLHNGCVNASSLFPIFQSMLVHVPR